MGFKKHIYHRGGNDARLKIEGGTMNGGKGVLKKTVDLIIFYFTCIGTD